MNTAHRLTANPKDICFVYDFDGGGPDYVNQDYMMGGYPYAAVNERLGRQFLAYEVLDYKTGLTPLEKPPPQGGR